MRGGREEEKIVSPLFPRLHVSDTEKGGPRAPPRNKMALYEQLSVPSQRFGSPAASTLPLPRHNASTLVSPASSSQGGGQERAMFSPSPLPSCKPAYSTDNVHSRSSDVLKLDTCRADVERKSAKHTSQRTVNASRHLLSSAERTFILHASPKDSHVKISEDEDDFRVPTFDSKTAPSSDKDPSHVMNREGPTAYNANSSHKRSAATFNSSLPLSTSDDKLLERPSTTELIPREHKRSDVNKRAKETVTHKEYKEKTIAHLETGERIAEPSNLAKESSRKEHSGREVNALENPEILDARIRQQSSHNGTSVGQRFLDDIEVMDKYDASWVRKGSPTRKSLGGNVRSPVGEINTVVVDKSPGSTEPQDNEKNDEVSETSTVDFLCGFDISPDDVVGVIGPKHFWKARRVIVNQQRVFAVQVFELHRLIVVQKLMAASPHILEGSPCLCESLLQAPKRNLASECIEKSELEFVNQEDEFVKQKDDCQRQDNNICPAKSTVGATPLFSCEDGLGKASTGQVSRNVPYPGIATPLPGASDYKPSTWHFHNPGNQWLIPVMSPSEGLIYKPYAGPYPPAASFMAPVYGGCGPPSLPPVTGDFMIAAYGVPAAHQQQNVGNFPGSPAVTPSYFPTPYGLPVVNSIISTSAVEHVNQLAGQYPSGQAEQHSRSSCNMSKPRSEALTTCVKFQTSKVRELHGSTASSHCESLQEGRNALPHFPTGMASKGIGWPTQDHNGDHQARVIKVVPHNPRSATESAARIFRSIQRERQQ